MTEQGQGYPPPADPGAAAPQPPYPVQPGYGQPYLQQPPYPPQPGYGLAPDETAVMGQPAGYPPPGFGAQRFGYRTMLFGGIGAVAVVALAVGGYFLFSGGDGSSGSDAPVATVKQFMQAAQGHDLTATKQLLCKADVAHGLQNSVTGAARILSYSVGATTTRNGVTTVTLRSSTTLDPQPTTEQIPVVSEGGSWKVCISDETPPSRLAGARPGAGRPSVGARPTRSTRPTEADLPAEPGPTKVIHRASPARRPSASVHPSRPVAGPRPGPSICSGAANGLNAAEIYVGTAQSGLATYAQTCVYANRVPLSVTRSLTGKKYRPQTSDPNAGRYVFVASGGGSRVTVTMAKLSGHYYVTGAQVG